MPSPAGWAFDVEVAVVVSPFYFVYHFLSTDVFPVLIGYLDICFPIELFLLFFIGHVFLYNDLKHRFNSIGVFADLTRYFHNANSILGTYLLRIYVYVNVSYSM